MNCNEISTLIETEISKICQLELIEAVSRNRIEPRVEDRDWDYGEPDQTFPCWIVLEDKSRNVAVAFCDQGFGPAYPWGLLFVSGPDMSMGTDASWFLSLEDAVRSSSLWTGANPPGFEIN